MSGLRADGGMDVVWTLRPGVTWHDGTPFTSADVQFTVDAINGPNYNPESTDGFDRITSVDTPDPLTAVVHYKEIYAPYDIQFIRGALPKHILQGRDIDRAQDYNRNPLGTGPYRVVEWKAGEYILLERVPHYWRGDEYPKIRRLLFKFVANTNTRINQLKSGEVHVVALAPWDKYREMTGIPSIVVTKTRGNAYEHVTLNERQFPPFADVRVRRALISALDRELYTRTILDGLAPVADGPIQPVSWAYNDRITRYAFDPAKARALLDEAGWKAGADGIRVRDGKRLAFTLITQAGYAIRESMAQAIERQLRDVGVDVKVELQDGTAISAIWFEGRFDAMLHWWQMPSDPELTTVLRGGSHTAGRPQHQLLPRRRSHAAAVCLRPHRRSRGTQGSSSNARRRSSPTPCRRFRCTASRVSTRCPSRSATSRATRPTPASSGTCTNGKSNKLSPCSGSSSAAAFRPSRCSSSSRRWCSC